VDGADCIGAHSTPQCAVSDAHIYRPDGVAISTKQGCEAALPLCPLPIAARLHPDSLVVVSGLRVIRLAEVRVPRGFAPLPKLSGGRNL
jgi:hypothetical protein